MNFLVHAIALAIQEAFLLLVTTRHILQFAGETVQVKRGPRSHMCHALIIARAASMMYFLFQLHTCIIALPLALPVAAVSHASVRLARVLHSLKVIEVHLYLELLVALVNYCVVHANHGLFVY